MGFLCKNNIIQQNGYEFQLAQGGSPALLTNMTEEMN